MAHNLVESDLPWIELPGGWKLTFEARSTTTDAAVANVSVSQVAIYGDSLNLGSVIERVIPGWVPDEVTSKG